MSAPASHASRISVGLKQPGMTGTSRAWHASITARRNTGLTTNRAPASMTRRTVSASVTVPAPSRKPVGHRRRQLGDQLHGAGHRHRDLEAPSARLSASASTTARRRERLLDPDDGDDAGAFDGGGDGLRVSLIDVDPIVM